LHNMLLGARYLPGAGCSCLICYVVPAIGLALAVPAYMLHDARHCISMELAVSA
jgi:hypothetical protein